MMLNQPQGNQFRSGDSQQESRNHPAVGAVPVPTPIKKSPGIADGGLNSWSTTEEKHLNNRAKAHGCATADN